MHETVRQVSAKKPKPILFSTPMVRALREGEKTQTRRILKPQFVADLDDFKISRALQTVRGAYGDVLWVREAWRVDASFDHLSPRRIETACLFNGYKKGWAPIAYDAGGYSPSWGTNGWCEMGRRRASMHMPRWASRLTLEVTGVKIERLQDISEADAKAEGIEYAGLVDRAAVGLWCSIRKLAEFQDTRWPVSGYAALWEHINGAGSWEANPWVVAVIFKVHRMNVDAFLEQRERAVA